MDELIAAAVQLIAEQQEMLTRFLYLLEGIEIRAKELAEA